MEKFVMAGDTAVRYRDVGIGDRAILLIHGYLCSLEVWDDFAGMLGKEYRVISFDVPGHGISEVKGEIHTMEFIADTIAALLQKIEVEKVDVVGHSMGGYIALAFAKKYEQMCSSIALFHSHPNCDSEEKKADRKREIEIIKSGRKELLTTRNPSRGFAKHNRKRLIAAIDELSEQAMLTEDEGIIALLNGMAQKEDMSQFLKESALRQLFVYGMHDEIFPVEYAKQLADNNPQATIAWLQESAHMGFIEEPQKTLEILKEFLNN